MMKQLLVFALLLLASSANPDFIDQRFDKFVAIADLLSLYTPYIQQALIETGYVQRREEAEPFILRELKSGVELARNDAVKNYELNPFTEEEFEKRVQNAQKGIQRGVEYLTKGLNQFEIEEEMKIYLEEMEEDGVTIGEKTRQILNELIWKN